MKKTLTKIWGIWLIVVILASLMMVATPASPAAAGTLAWSNQGVPSGVFYQLANGSDVSFVTVAPNGDIFAVNTASANDTIYKSTNGGRTYSATQPDTAASAPWGAQIPVQYVVAVAVSPAYATDGTVFVLATDGISVNRLYMSTNSGVTFSVLGGAIGTAGVATSIAVAPNYAAGTGEIMVGTVNAGAGSVYIWGKNGVLDWTNTTAAVDVTSVAYSPYYQVDGTRIAVGSNATSTGLHTKVAGEAGWDGTISAISVIVAEGSANITGSAIVVPSDFNSTSLFTRGLYVAIRSSDTNDNVYRQSVGTTFAAVALNPLAPYLTVTDQEVTSLAYSGTEAAGTLYAGTAVGGTATVVYTTGAPSATASVPPTWSPPLAAPTGTGPTYVALANDYATSSKVYAGTSGTDSALSVASDGGMYYYQAGLIDTSIINVTDIATPNATDFFLSTNNGATTSLWRSLDSGASWYRIYSITATNGILRTSPNYATDSTVVFGQVGGTVLKVSNNKGSSWNALVSASPVNIADIAMKDQYTFYVASSNTLTVATTLNGGYYFSPAPTTIAYAGGSGVTSLAINVATGTLLAGTNGGSVSYSTNGNTSWLPGISGLGAGTTLVAFDYNYATNNTIYAVDSAVAGVQRWVIGTSTSWANIDSGIVGNTSAAGTVGDILTTPDGSLYVSDNTAANGLHRSNNPTYGNAASTYPNWNTISTARLPTWGATATTTLLSWVAGSNVIYAVDSANNKIHTYTDTLTAVAPAQVSPAQEAVLTSTSSVLFSWNSVAGAFKYEVEYATRSDFAGSTTLTTVNNFDTSVGTTALTGGMTYYWRVRVSIPLYSQWSETHSFITELSIVNPNAPGSLAVIPATGGYISSMTPTFSWTSVKTASGYEFQLATDAQFLFPVIDLTGEEALGAVNAYTVTTTLEYGTTYFWRVKAITSTTNTDWSSTATFTTMAKPAPPTTTQPNTITVTAPTPTVTVSIPTISVPTPTVTVSIPPQPTPTEEKIAPAYIWAIIIIGAVLVIAVIVLIVRTRRSV